MENEPFVGEPLALDLVNTRAMIASGPIDHLDELAAARAWIALLAGRLPVSIKLDEEARTAVLRLRDSIADAVDAVRNGRLPASGDLAAITKAQREAPLIQEAVVDGGRVKLSARRHGSKVQQVLAAFADSAAITLAEPDVPIRKCEADDCVVIFAATNLRRRWCSSVRCGNRHRVADYYRRSKSGQ